MPYGNPGAPKRRRDPGGALANGGIVWASLARRIAVLAAATCPAGLPAIVQAAGQQGWRVVGIPRL